MKILFLCHRYPYPPNRGGKIRPFNMIRHLSQNNRVAVCTLAHSNAEVSEGADLNNYCAEVLAEVIPSPRRWARAAAALPTTASSSQRYFHSTRLRRRIRDFASRFRPDAVIVHCAFMAEYVRDIRAPFRMLDFGDLDSRKWADYAKYRAFPLSAGYALEAFKLGRIEKQLARQFDQYTVTAPGELESFWELGSNTPCTVIPNGVDADYFNSPGKHDSDSRTIVFLGRMDYYPNVAGILGFVKDAFPLILRRFPGVQLRIVGSNPVAEIKELEKQGSISVTGFVPDVRPFVNDAAVAIAPLSIARGTQNKVLECMAMKIPVVTSAQVAKGVQAVPGRHFLVGRTPEEFATQVITLLSDPDLRVSMGNEARARVLSAHCWERSMRLLDSLLSHSVDVGMTSPVRATAPMAGCDRA